MRMPSFVSLFFYLILIGVSIKSWINLMNEHTTFEEKIVENEAQIPSFTLCPTQPIDPISNKSIESFEDVEKAIENVRDRFTMVYTDYKPYEDYKIVNYKYNDTSSGIWYFVPKVSMDPPFETVICLIWTPSREHKIKPDWSVEVNLFFNFKVIPIDTQ